MNSGLFNALVNLASNDTVVGALIGAAATLLGVLAAHWLGVVAERRKSRRHLAGLTRSLAAEIRGHLPVLQDDAATPVPLASSVYETVKAGGHLGDLPSGAASEIVELYAKYAEINDQVALLRTLLAAMFSAGASLSDRRGLQGFYDRIRDLKRSAKVIAERCLNSLESAA